MDSALVRPAAAAFDAKVGEFVLPYDVVRSLADPDAAVQPGRPWSTADAALQEPGYVELQSVSRTCRGR